MDFQIENIKQLMDGLDITALFPKLQSVLDWGILLCRLAMLVGPIVMLALGLQYFFAAPKKANYSVGYRTRWGMGSVKAWRFTQRLAGIVWGGVGILLTLVMLILVLVYAKLPLGELVWKCLWCLVWQVAIMGLSCLVINTIVLLRYDKDGKRRKSWKALIGL